jgi:uncharacterized protein (DUF486 family)
MNGVFCVVLLILSNFFMTLAWYGHLQFKKVSWLEGLGLFSAVLISWGLAFFEYVLQVPANKIGFTENGGPFNLFQLKLIQEVISLLVFTVTAVFLFKSKDFNWNYLIAFIFILLAVYFIFKK